MVTSNVQSSTSLLLPSARGYQREMLEQSMKRNIVVALDTGAGKTLIAILRIKGFLEQEKKKVAWFLTPTVLLCEQQQDVIAKALPVPVGLISGALEPNSWTDRSLWEGIVRDYRVVVSTPQVLLDAMHHGYISIGADVGLLVFDEAHHVADKHPYNMIMRNFYFSLPPAGTGDVCRPAVLGLTASPSFGTNVVRSLEAIESNLDSIVIAPHTYREELATYVHRPKFKAAFFNLPLFALEEPPSVNVIALSNVVASLNIEDDPYIKSLRSQLMTLPEGPQRTRVDQKLSKSILNQNTYTHKGLRDFLRTAKDICYNLGTWAADWFVYKVVERARASASPYKSILNQWEQQEKEYLLQKLLRISIEPISYDPAVITAGLSNKVEELIECLEMEKAIAESLDDTFSGLIFITRRDEVLALAAILDHHPKTADVFSIGRLLGSSDSSYRRSFLDITRELLPESQTKTLADFRIGEKNLIVSTAVAEEGLDIQACNAVIRMDPPPNMVSWAQSRGRARRKESSYVLMLAREGSEVEKVKKWGELEATMIEFYNSEREQAEQSQLKEETEGESDVINDPTCFRVEKTGALLTLDSAVPHLEHFCSILPNGNHTPIYEIDPPDLPEGWHCSTDRTVSRYQGLYGATVTLPKLLDQRLRIFTVPRIYSSKRLARSHAAYNAYLALYDAELVNDNLLPLTSVLEPDKGKAVEELLKDVEQRQGTATVSSQMNPWDPEEDTSGRWKATRLSISGLPPLKMYTRSSLRLSQGEETFKLYPSNEEPLSASLSCLGENDTDDEVILQRAQLFTRDLFWPVHNSRMKWDELDFQYLFLPERNDPDEWTKRRQWWRQELEAREIFTHERDFHANARQLGEAYGWPHDLSVIQEQHGASTIYQFISWRTDYVSEEEMVGLTKKYSHMMDFEVDYPILEVEALPRRANFLIPGGSITAGARGETKTSTSPSLLLPQFAQVVLASPSYIEHSLLLPSVLRYTAMSSTLNSFRETHLLGTGLHDIPADLLMMAMTAPVAQEKGDYQRLETLGDTALKFMVTLQLLASHPLWHEGYLARAKDHAVSNAQLAKHAIRLDLYRWIIRDRFVPRKWRPARIQATAHDNVPDASKKQDLSTKLLADVVESLIGASVLTGGFELARECTQMFGLGLKNWQPLKVHVESMVKRAEEIPDFPLEVEHVEKILGYTFSHRALLIEALTHSSHQSSLPISSYERMEFLGDAVLDWIVTDFLYNAPGKEYSPGQIHLRKSAVVNQHFLGYLCLEASLPVEVVMPGPDSTGKIVPMHKTQHVHLFQLLLHSNHRVVDDQTDSFTRYQRDGPDIKKALDTGDVFPWAALTRLQAAKFFSDMIESLIGAAFLDANGDFEVIRGILRTLGILPVLERIVKDGVDVQHPISRLGIWASKRQKKVKYVFDKNAGKVICTVALHDKDDEGEWSEDGIVVCQVAALFRGKRTEMETRFVAAERAMRILDPNPHEELFEEDLEPYLDLDGDAEDDSTLNSSDL